ncbi:hypothetical protein HDU85_007779 [Gaertneriomyces sp. JEL0708]|nr:hypothetical protein HDU85_007779 [Gaertneriomyces sp. JEL0708]
MAFAASAVAPMTGRFRRKVIRDLVGSVSLGLVFGYTWWYGFHLPKMQHWKAYDQKVREEILAEQGSLGALGGMGQQAAVDEKRGYVAPGQTVE